MSIVVKKRVSLDLLGEDYKDSFIILRSVPVKEYESLLGKIAKAKPGDSLKLITDEIVDRFVSGKIAQEGGMVDLKAEELRELPGEVFLEAWDLITGKPSPKA